MSRSKKPRNAGPILIVGGVIIAVITLGGAYLSRHPDVIGKLFRSSGSGMDYAAMDQQITIPESCAAVPTHAFQLLCDEIGNIAPPAWDQALSAEEKPALARLLTNTDRSLWHYTMKPKQIMMTLTEMHIPFCCV